MRDDLQLLEEAPTNLRSGYRVFHLRDFGLHVLGLSLQGVNIVLNRLCTVLALKDGRVALVGARLGQESRTRLEANSRHQDSHAIREGGEFRVEGSTTAAEVGLADLLLHRLGAVLERSHNLLERGDPAGQAVPHSMRDDLHLLEEAGTANLRSRDLILHLSDLRLYIVGPGLQIRNVVLDCLCVGLMLHESLVVL